MHTTTTIDMLTPTETCVHLHVDETVVLDLVNSGRLPAYRLGGHVRFKTIDVAALADAMVAA